MFKNWQAYWKLLLENKNVQNVQKHKDVFKTVNLYFKLLPKKTITLQ